MIFVTVEVIAEVVYVLNRVYSMERDMLADTIKGFLELVSCQEKDVPDFALDTFGDRNLDFVDCVLYGYHVIKSVEIATFDKKLLKLMAHG